MTGRPTKQTAQNVKALEEMLRQGIPTRVAARWLGLGDSTVRDWIAAGDDVSARLREAAQAVPKRAVQIIARKIEEDEREDLAQWWLERRVPEFRKVNGAPEPILDLWDQLDEDSQNKARTIIVEGLAKKDRAP